MQNEQRYFPIRQFTITLFDAAFMMVKYRRFLKMIDKKFRSEIMLAVTFVTGCCAVTTIPRS